MFKIFVEYFLVSGFALIMNFLRKKYRGVCFIDCQFQGLVRYLFVKRFVVFVKFVRDILR